jgi:hypothetical protein
MTMLKSRKNFLETDEGQEIKLKLQEMGESGLYNTRSSYTSNTELYPDNLMSFVDKHINYLVNHPELEPKTYLANVRLVTRLSRIRV